ncbi:hypothetical protein R3P38DRAFT_3193160 [Favolaschia claudopus]|uniref:Uncharacterized protein n=1 Tax=Favolaschia claudopus TaxID=2862362 RepID=A0AAW0BI85_9AGAR
MPPAVLCTTDPIARALTNPQIKIPHWLNVLLRTRVAVKTTSAASVEDWFTTAFADLPIRK